MAELQKLADDAAGGIRDPERMRQAAERMDRMREETCTSMGCSTSNCRRSANYVTPLENKIHELQSIRDGMKHKAPEKGG
ncbi:MAG: hypothetical protein WKF75_12730 [Singulisphaera sp.]